MGMKTVLVVDDSPTIRKIVEITLRKAGYTVITAESGLSALAAVADRAPDLILLDVMLPNLNGYQVCQLLKRNARSRGVPIVMLSGRDGVFDKMKGKLVGATDYVTKPFEPGKLIAAVGKYCGDGVAKTVSGVSAVVHERAG
jgi:twitching motility two-component system response regulator PilG